MRGPGRRVVRRTRSAVMGWVEPVGGEEEGGNSADRALLELMGPSVEEEAGEGEDEEDDDI